MSREISVRVVDSNDDPVSDARVKILVTMGGWDGMQGGWLDPERTDDDGYARFETDQDYPDDHTFKIFVGDDEFGPYEFGDDDDFTVSV